MAITEADLTRITQDVVANIDENELVALATELGSIYSPTGHEGPACDRVFEWMHDQGFAPEKVGVFDDRYNILGRLKGSGSGYSLAFNSHLDTIMSREDALMYRNADLDVYHQSWVDDERRVWGVAMVNCKGPMACWLIAAKAIKEAGVELKGDLLLCPVVGEIDQEPVDEFQGHRYLAEDIGTRYLISHGGIPDFALVAEATNLKPGWVEAGKVFFKITIMAGPSRYSPYVVHADNLDDAANAAVRASQFIQVFERWAKDYEDRYTWDCPGGTVVPKASIGAVRAGLPYKIYRQPELCNLYIDVRLNPVTNPLDIQAELRQLLEEGGFEYEIKPFLYRRGYEAQGIEPLRDAVEQAHQAIVGRPTEKPGSPEVSMWRDTNPYNEMGIPSLTYGPGGGAGGGTQYFTIDEMVEGAKIYALTALDICMREKSNR
jgi:acetylornithine deacetylase/succinyl-diaminopimelate desuccinylase-like protein